MVRDATALVYFYSAWVAAERVRERDHDAWLAAKRTGPGRDLRLAASRRDAAGSRYMSLEEAMSLWRPVDLATTKDWPHQGPRAECAVRHDLLASPPWVVQSCAPGIVTCAAMCLIALKAVPRLISDAI